MKINELVGKEAQLYPGDTNEKYGVIEDWNEQGLIIKITKSTCRRYTVGVSYYLSHGSNISLAIL